MEKGETYNHGPFASTLFTGVNDALPNHFTCPTEVITDSRSKQTSCLSAWGVKPDVQSTTLLMGPLHFDPSQFKRLNLAVLLSKLELE